jgi:outer membrane protein OmpA-like peptidoglycan-associated protein
MSDKRRRRLFGKPIPNPAAEAAEVAEVAEAAKAALSTAKNAGAKAAGSSVAAGSAASSAAGASLSSAAEKAADKVSDKASGKVSERVSDKVSDSADKAAGTIGEDLSATPKSVNTISTVDTVNTAKATEWVPSRGKRALPLALGALGLVGLTGLQFAARGNVEDELREQSLRKLKDEFPDLKVRMEGRDAYLDGTVVDAESRQRAHDLVRKIKGVRHVEDPKVVSPAPADVAADAQVPLTVDTTAPIDTAAAGMASIAEVTGDTVPAVTVPAVAADSVPAETTVAETVAPTTAGPTTIEPTTIAPTTVEPSTIEPTTVPASVLATSVPTTIVVAPTEGEPVATVVPTGEPIDPIRFGRASTDLAPETSADIDRIASFLSANPNVEIGVAGYADSRGTKLQNMALAKVRAENVRQALIDRGIAAPRIKAVWFGDRSPVADNATEDGRSFNRRVEFRFFDAAIDAASAYGQDVSFTG